MKKVLWNFRSSDDRAFDRQSKGPGLDTQRSRSVPFFTEKKKFLKKQAYKNLSLLKFEFEIILGAQLSTRYFFDKMQLDCEKMVTNKLFKVLHIINYNFCSSFW